MAEFATAEGFDGFPITILEAFKYLSQLPQRGTKPNVELRLAAQFARAQSSAQRLIRRRKVLATPGRMTCVFPVGGIQDHTINRLLLMSSSEHHMPSVPMAFVIHRP